MKKLLKKWKTIGIRDSIFLNDFLKIELHDIKLPNGNIIKGWPLILTPDSITIFVETENKRYLIMRQRKYAISYISLSLVGGYIAAGETPLRAAKRELLEETGYIATKWKKMGSSVVDGNRGIGTVHMFLATNAYQKCSKTSDDLEETEILFMTLNDVKVSLTKNKFRTLPWLTTVLLGLRALNQS